MQRPHDEEDHVYAMAHKDEAVPLHPSLAAPGERLLPYPNLAKLPPLPPQPQLNTTSSFSPRGTARG